LALEDNEYLDLFKINEGKYLIGVYQGGITVYKQQLRALNIFHTLVKTGKIALASDFSIAIIGGGVAGLTFAAAALKANISVAIFEKAPNYLHMQHGCDTRKIHPNIYDWPDEGSTFPNARLPVLSWTHNTASHVVKQILKGLDEIKQQIDDSDHLEAPGLFTRHFQGEILKINEPTPETRGKFTIEYKKNSSKSTTYCNLIIFAVGYGVEEKLEESDVPSYWRNDALGQSMLNESKGSFLISGTGDGGLMDLFRLKIRDFDYDMLLDIFKTEINKYNKLVAKLAEIKERGNTRAGLDPGFCYREFDQLPPNYYEYILEALNDKIRDNNVILHNRNEFKKALKFRKISLLNAFLAYILFTRSIFETLKGELTYKKDIDQYFIDGNKISDIEQGVIRYGTDRDKIIEGLKLTPAEVEKIKVLKKRQETVGNQPQRWTFSDIDQCFHSGSSNPDYSVLIPGKRNGYLTPDTHAICVGQVITLAKTLNDYHKKEKHFRLALHRVTRLDNEYYFQQITPYAGSKVPTDNGCVQNIYQVDHGIVGQAIQAGRPLIVCKSDEPAFKELMPQLQLDKSYDKDGSPKAFLAIPILAPFLKKGSKVENMAANLILYVDAEEINFFTDEIYKLIYSSLTGLIDYIQRLIEIKQITMSEREYDPTIISNNFPEQLLANSCFSDLGTRFEELFSTQKLGFKDYHSFDIIYNK